MLPRKRCFVCVKTACRWKKWPSKGGIRIGVSIFFLKIFPPICSRDSLACRRVTYWNQPRTATDSNCAESSRKSSRKRTIRRWDCESSSGFLIGISPSSAASTPNDDLAPSLRQNENARQRNSETDIGVPVRFRRRSEEHTSELQSPM